MQHLSFEGIKRSHRLCVLKMHFWATGYLTRNSFYHLTNPHRHPLDEMKILFSQSCVGFSTNVSSEERLFVL